MFTEEELAREEWRDIPEYEGIYLISNLGRVKRLPLGKQWPYRRTHNNIRKQKIKNNGYLMVNLSKDNKVRWYQVHRLVAMAFIPNPGHLPFVNHKDETRTNNRVENLEWCTHQYNVNYGTARERMVKTKAANPEMRKVWQRVGEKNSRAVRQLTPNGEYITTFRSMKEASEVTGVSLSTIVQHCNGRIGNKINRPIRKYKFEYV